MNKETIILGQRMNYYAERLEMIREYWLRNNKKLLEQNKDKIARLVEGYEQFKNYPNYDTSLIILANSCIGRNN